jgi:tRNA(Ile)-lysidine synthase
MNLLAKVDSFIATQGLLQPGQRLVAAVSGGADSLCLMDCLHRLGFRLVVASLDHQLRPESAEDCRFVQDVARAYTDEVVLGTADVRALADQGLSVEEAARRLRYRFLVRVAQDRDARTIATGHTADDQAETILMHLLRGAGLEGLRGMLPSTALSDWSDIGASKGLSLVRPLLEITREETRGHCAAIGLTPREDHTNQDRSLLRNRLRHDLLPTLESYNPQVRESLWRLGRLMAAQAEFVDQTVAAVWAEVVRSRGERAFGIDASALATQPEAIQRALARRAILLLRPGLRDLGWETTERIRAFVELPPQTRHLEVLGGLELFHLGPEVVMAERGGRLEFPEFPQLVSHAWQALTIPGEVALECGWRLTSGETPLGKRGGDPSSGDVPEREAILDADRLPGPLGVRGPRAGDRIRPLGMGGSAKVADMLINQHIPRPARPRWPVVVAGDEPVWVAGLRVSDAFRLTAQTSRGICLRLLPS